MNTCGEPIENQSKPWQTLKNLRGKKCLALLIHGAINAVWGHVLGGSGGGFGRCGEMFWEVRGRLLDVKKLALLIHGAINAVWGDVLGGSGGGFGRCGRMFWEVWGRFLDVKHLEKN